MIHSAALVQFNPRRIFRSLSFRVDEDTNRRLRTIREGLVARGLHPTSEADLVRFAIAKLDEALDTVPPATRFANSDAFRVTVEPVSPKACDCGRDA